jgi:hypothetical protein
MKSADKATYFIASTLRPAVSAGRRFVLLAGLNVAELT